MRKMTREEKKTLKQEAKMQKNALKQEKKQLARDIKDTLQKWSSIKDRYSGKTMSDVPAIGIGIGVFGLFTGGVFTLPACAFIAGMTHTSTLVRHFSKVNQTNRAGQSVRANSLVHTALVNMESEINLSFREYKAAPTDETFLAFKKVADEIEHDIKILKSLIDIQSGGPYDMGVREFQTAIERVNHGEGTIEITTLFNYKSKLTNDNKADVPKIENDIKDIKRLEHQKPMRNKKFGL